MANESTAKEARTWNGERNVSSINGAGKTGQIHVVNETIPLAYTTLKNKVRMD